MISTELDLAKRLFAFAGMQSAVSDGTATSVRVGIVTQLNADGSISVQLSDTGETVYLRTSTPVKVGDTVSIIKQGGVYVVYALDALSEQISKQEQELIDFAGALGDLGAQIDGKVETHFYNYQPTTGNIPASQWSADEKQAHAGDLFYNTSNGYVYRWTGSAWQQITDSRIQGALDAASKAEDTADSKRRVFTSQPTVPYDRGDLWVNVSNPGDLKVAKYSETTRFYSSDWVNATNYTDDSAVNQVIDSFNLTVEPASVTITKDKNTASTVPRISSSTAKWWTFTPAGASNAPTIGYFTCVVDNLQIPHRMGGTDNCQSSYVFKVYWPDAFGSLSTTLPISIVGASPDSSHMDALSWNRSNSYITCVFTRPYLSSEIKSARLEIMAVTR